MLKNPNRKVLSMGKNGLCITLPMEWTEARGIKKGDVMQLVEVGKGLHMVKVEG
jgi:bifunctional DNA-binding transcriptional regulator/antitoxin component of YhaV-PrlF toxin-antitoxin module